MKKLITFTSAAVAATALFAAPQVSDVALTQDASRTVTITYKLKGEPGIVTVDIQTNAGEKGWVSIGGQHLTYFGGDANKVVQPSDTETRTITWKPRKAWPDNQVTENVKAVLSAWALNAPPDYMVVSLTASKYVRYYTCAENVPFGVSNDMYKTEYLVMRKVPAANVTWRKGSPTTETGRSATREVPHVITMPNDYYVGVYEVTQRQYELILGTRPSYFKLDADYATRPVESISYEDVRGTTGCIWPNNLHAVKSDCFIGKLRTHSGLNGFDLPRGGVGVRLPGGLWRGAQQRDGT